MKTRKLFSAAFLMSGALAMFSSCSNDEGVLNGDNEEAVQTISLAVANTGDNFLGSRANRPLYSSEANQSIDNVKVVIYKLEGVKNVQSATAENMYGKNMTIVAQKLFTPWMNGGVSSLYSDAGNGHGRQASWTLATADLIKTPGVYMAYAVGYNTDDYTELTAFNALAKDGTADFPLSVTVGKGVKEIFAGSTVFEVTEKTAATATTNNPSYHFNAKLVLHRQVAGAIGYFTNIPVKGNADFSEKTGERLRLVASAENSKAVFAGFNSDFTGGNPSTKPSTVQYVVNGFSTEHAQADAKFYGSAVNDAHTVYEATLSDWFTGGDLNNDGLLNENDTWKNKIDPENKTVKVDKGSVLASSFMIPFQYVADKATFQLQMLDAQGEIIRYWNIRLPQGKDSQVGSNVTLVKEDGTTTEAQTADNAINYSIVRNHLYNIGVRDNGNGGGGTTDPQPDPDPDKPQDLNDETLILRVNDNWEMIHQMEVD